MFVYWIHRPNHTDPKLEGYIGISKDPEKRFKTHKYTTNEHLKNAFLKYDDIILSILLEDDIEQCKLFEKNFRPFRNIGWNISEGGGMPPKSTSERAYKIAKVKKENGTNFPSEELIKKRWKTRVNNGNHLGLTRRKEKSSKL